MREIKFRAWDVKDKRMHYGGFSIHATGKIESLGGLGPTNPIVMQYVGLQDKNGCEIYEGDVLSWRTSDGEEIQRDVVYWEDSEAGFDGTANGWSHTGFYTVVGNIHENPELLK